MSDELARQLRRVREASGRSLRELERVMHVSNSSLSRYLSGQAVPPWPVVVALCKVAGQDPRPLRPLWEGSKRAPRPPSSPAPTARNDLPHDITTFTGRRDELATVLAATRTARIVAVDGMAGVGKTTLAVHAAHRLTAGYPDGQLYVDLHGFTPGRKPVAPAEALRVLLASLGVAPTRVPEDTDERAALWRAELAYRRAVVILDNAADAAHVRPLLPGAGDSLVLITSRRRMVDIDGVFPLSLDVLPPDDAAELFAAAVGDARAAHSPAVVEVLHQCGNLPLALRIAAARLRHRPAWTADTLVDRLRVGDLGTTSAFGMSVRQLDAAQRRMFRLLGQVPSTDIAPHAAAALAGIPLNNAQSLLDDLVDAHLVQEPAPDRYRQHDLLREHARTIAADEETAGTRRGALTRLFDHYLYTASTAIDVLYPQSSHLRPRVPEPDTPTVRFASAAAATTWLDAERANLIGAGAYAADHEWPAHTGLLAATLYPYFDGHAHHADALDLYTTALQASRRLGDKTGEAQALLGRVVMSWRQGRYEQTFEYSQRALDLSRETGDRYGEARALNGLGNVYLLHRDYDRATEHFRNALDLSREVGDRLGEAILLSNLGLVHERSGDHEQASEHHRQALDLHRDLGSLGGEATALGNLGLLHRRQGHHEQAVAHHRRALDLYRQLGYPSGEADALNALAEVAQAMDDSDQAVADHYAALARADDAGNLPEQARAHDGLARAHHRLGHPDLARDHAKRALDLYTRLGVPEADETRAFLTDIG